MDTNNQDNQDNQDNQELKNKLAEDIKAERLVGVLTSITLKGLFAIGICYFLLRGALSEAGFLSQVLTFLIFYSIATLYTVSLRITRNYFIAIIVMVAMGIGIVYVMDRVDIMAGQNPIITDVILYGVFVSPIIFDVLKIVRVVKKR